MADAPNPERRSNTALILFCAGAVLCGIAYILGLGTVIAIASSGENPAAAVGGIVSAILLGATGIIGGLLMLIGVIWLFARVIADSRDEHDRDRYSKDVER